jgi:uncharacterized membrane protein
MMGTGLFGCCGWGGSFGSYGWIGMIAGIIINILVIVAIIWLVRRLSSKGSRENSFFNQPSAEQSPREILQARYAHGEITREQYLEILADLS